MVAIEKLRIATKVTASSLLEVIVAMVIIMVVFTLAIGIFTRVVRSSPSLEDQRLQLITTTVIQETIVSKDFSNASVFVDSLLIKKEIVPFEDYEDVLLIKVTAVKSGVQVAQSKQLIRFGGDEF